MTETTFEQAMERLDEISSALSENNVTLDESLALYEERVKLIDFCNSKLRRAKLRIEKIDGGKFEDTNG